MQKSSRKLLKSVLIHIVMVEIFLVEPDPMLLLPRAPATPDPGPVTPVTQRHSLRLRGPDWTVALAMVLARDSAHTLPYCHRGRATASTIQSGRTFIFIQFWPLLPLLHNRTKHNYNTHSTSSAKLSRLQRSD